MCRKDLEQDVQVADRPEAGPGLAQVAHVAAPRLALEAVAEDPPGSAHPARGDAHGVDLLGILAGDDPGHARQHPREVEAEHLASRLGPRIVAADAGCPPDREALHRLLRHVGRGAVTRVSVGHRIGACNLGGRVVGADVGHAFERTFSLVGRRQRYGRFQGGQQGTPS